MMNAKEEMLFAKVNSLDGGDSPNSDQLDLSDVITNNGTIKRKLESPEEPELGAMSPGKHLHLAGQQQNNNDASFVLIDDDGGGGTGPDDLASGDEEVSMLTYVTPLGILTTKWQVL